MKIKSLSWAVLATAILSFSSCHSGEETISYKEASHYFVRNDVTQFSPRIFTNNEELSQYFGIGAVMDPNGIPTPIDFEKENVIAIIEPETNNNTEIKIESIKKQNEKIVVKYRVVTSDEAGSYSTVPFQLVKISKKYGDKVDFIKE